MAEKSDELDRNTEYLSETNREKVEMADALSHEDSLEKYNETQTDISDETDQATDETDQIREQIEETRSNLSETIDAIQEKLSFQNISEQVKDTVSEQINSALETAKDNVYAATLGKAGKFMKNVGREISKTEAGKVAANNPFPLFLIGLGVGLFIYQGFNGKKRKQSYRYDYKTDYKYEDDEDGDKNYRKKSTLKATRNQIGDAYEKVSSVTGDALGKVGAAASSAYEGVSDTANSTYSGVKNFAVDTYDKAGDYSTKAVETYEHYIEENPLAVGAVALAVGAAVGLSIPSTRYEGQMLGEYRQQVFAKAQNVAGDLVDRVKEVASEAQKTIGDEVKTAVSETQTTIKNEAKNQNLV